MTRWILYDDPASSCLRPFTWLRPASALLLGARTTDQRWRRRAAPEEVRIACRPLLAPLDAGRLSWFEAARLCLQPSEDTIWVSDLLLPDPELVGRLRLLPEGGVARSRGVLVAFRTGPRLRELLTSLSGRGGSAGIGGGASLSEWALASMSGFLDEVDHLGGPAYEVSSRMLTGLADLVRCQEELLPRDLEENLDDGLMSVGIGDGFAYKVDRIRVGRRSQIDHGAVLDAREGPILLGEDCTVAPHTWIRGPFWAGPGCRLLGGRIGGGSSLGPQCRVRGELEASLFLGFSNKTHDGFVGHSYLGEWVNLGALTTTSDLKNNYSCVILEPEGAPVRTDLRKVGVFLGDHVKTRIGCLLTCGTIVGVGANLIENPAVASKWVADFVWGNGPGGREYEINKFQKTAEIVLGRRGVEWPPALAVVLQDVFRATRAARAKQLGPGAADGRVG